MDFAAWLRGMGLEQYARSFRDNDADSEVLPQLTVDNLMSIGVTSVGHRPETARRDCLALRRGIRCCRDGCTPRDAGSRRRRSAAADGDVLRSCRPTALSAVRDRPLLAAMAICHC
jgi:hypothetical protein